MQVNLVLWKFCWSKPVSRLCFIVGVWFVMLALGWCHFRWRRFFYCRNLVPPNMSQKNPTVLEIVLGVSSFVVDFYWFDVIYLVHTIWWLNPIVSWSSIMQKYEVSWYRWELNRYKKCVTWSIMVQVGNIKKLNCVTVMWRRNGVTPYQTRLIQFST